VKIIYNHNVKVDIVGKVLGKFLFRLSFFLLETLKRPKYFQRQLTVILSFPAISHPMTTHEVRQNSA